jgi:ribosome-interacting GTPase 1
VADYPFTTRLPLPGMMAFEDVQIQLVDLPPVSAEFTEPWLGQVIRNADASVLVVGLDDAAALEEIELVLAKLAEWRAASPKILAANKADAAGAADTLAVLTELYANRFPFAVFSAATGQGLDDFRRAWCIRTSLKT